MRLNSLMVLLVGVIAAAALTVGVAVAVAGSLDLSGNIRVILVPFMLGFYLLWRVISWRWK